MPIGKLYVMKYPVRQKTLREEEGNASQLKSAGLPKLKIRGDYALNTTGSFSQDEAEKQERVRQRVASEFITDRHMSAFENIAREKNVILSVRESGIYTLNALNNGAAAKGHNILEKTIKDKTLKSVYGAKSDAMLANVTDAGLMGLVGSWKAREGKFSGVWVHNIQKERDEVFALNLSEKNDLMSFRDNIKARRIVPYTGDYDMHDIVLKATGAPPAVDSVEETEIINMINMQIARCDPSRPFDKKHMNPVRHGAQNNFIFHMWKNEQDEVREKGGYLSAVARPGPFPVAITDGHHWVIADTEDEWRSYFRDQCISQQPHWSTFPENIKELRTGLRETIPGYVLSPEHQVDVLKWSTGQ